MISWHYCITMDYSYGVLFLDTAFYTGLTPFKPDRIFPYTRLGISAAPLVGNTSKCISADTYPIQYWATWHKSSVLLFAIWHYGGLERTIGRKYTQHNLWSDRTLLHKGLQKTACLPRPPCVKRANIFHEWTEIMRKKRLNNKSSPYKYVNKCTEMPLSALVRFCSDHIGQQCG